MIGSVSSTGRWLSSDKTQAIEYYHKVLGVNSHNPTNAFARPIAKKKLD